MVTWLNLDQLSNYLQTPKSTLYKLRQSGKLPGYKVGRRWLFDPEEIDTYIKGRSETGAKKAKAKNETRKKRTSRRSP